MVLLILAVLWGAYIVSWYRSRETDRVDSVARFNRHLSVLERTTPAPIAPVRTVVAGDDGIHRISSTPTPAPAGGQLAPAGRTSAPVARPSGLPLADVYRRRRAILSTLALAAAATLVGALLAGGVLWAVHLVVDLALVSYLVLLVRAQQIATERRDKVHYLGSPERAEPVEVQVARPAVGG